MLPVIVKDVALEAVPRALQEHTEIEPRTGVNTWKAEEPDEVSYGVRLARLISCTPLKQHCHVTSPYPSDPSLHAFTRKPHDYEPLPYAVLFLPDSAGHFVRIWPRPCSTSAVATWLEDWWRSIQHWERSCHVSTAWYMDLLGFLFCGTKQMDLQAQSFSDFIEGNARLPCHHAVQ